MLVKYIATWIRPDDGHHEYHTLCEIDELNYIPTMGDDFGVIGREKANVITNVVRVVGYGVHAFIRVKDEDVANEIIDSLNKVMKA